MSLKKKPELSPTFRFPPVNSLYEIVWIWQCFSFLSNKQSLRVEIVKLPSRKKKKEKEKRDTRAHILLTVYAMIKGFGLYWNFKDIKMWKKNAVLFFLSYNQQSCDGTETSIFILFGCLVWFRKKTNKDTFVLVKT